MEKKNLTAEKLNYLHSLLDKELQNKDDNVGFEAQPEERDE